MKKSLSLAFKKTLPLCAPILSGVLLSLCYPPHNHWLLVWVWFFPLLSVLWHPKTDSKEAPLCASVPPSLCAFHPFLKGYLCGYVFFLCSLSWIAEVSALGRWLLPLYLGLYFGVWTWFSARFARPDQKKYAPSKTSEKKHLITHFLPSLHLLQIAFLNASAWVALEWLRATLFTGFGWNGLGVALHAQITLIQMADTLGVYGLSFVPCFVGILFYLTLHSLILEQRGKQRRVHFEFMFAVLLLIGVFFYGLSKLSTPPNAKETKEMTALLIQANHSQAKRADPEAMDEIYQDYAQMTADLSQEPANDQNIDLVIWPESSLYWPWNADRPEQQIWINQHLLPLGNFALLFGTETYLDGKIRFNSAVFIEGDALTNATLHHKQHLVPFGEYLPLRGIFPPFEWVAGKLIPADFESGKKTQPFLFQKHDLQLIPLICFEDTLPSLARKFIASEKPQILVNMTNDGWFGQSGASAQHLANAKFRAIELRRPMLRAANTGVTTGIDPYGRLLPYSAETPETQHAIIEKNGRRYLHSHNGWHHPFEHWQPEQRATEKKGGLLLTLPYQTKQTTTFYARWGNVFCSLFLAISLLPVVLCFKKGFGKENKK